MRTSGALGVPIMGITKVAEDRSSGWQQSGQQHLMMGFSFMQSAKQSQGKVPHNWVLLDNQSTIDVSCNGTLLHNICQAATLYTVIPVQHQPTWKGICQVTVQCGTTLVGLQTSYPWEERNNTVGSLLTVRWETNF